MQSPSPSLPIYRTSLSIQKSKYDNTRKQEQKTIIGALPVGANLLLTVHGVNYGVQFQMLKDILMILFSEFSSGYNKQNVHFFKCDLEMRSIVKECKQHNNVALQTILFLFLQKIAISKILPQNQVEGQRIKQQDLQELNYSITNILNSQPIT